MEALDRPKRFGALSGLGWIAGALWWVKKSPSDWRALVACGLPWFVCAALFWPTGGLSLMACLALYAPASIWSALCARVFFLGSPFDLPEMKTAWKKAMPKARALALGFALACSAGSAWVVACSQLSGIGDLLKELQTTTDSSAPHSLFQLYWNKEGLDGLWWGWLAAQAGLGLVNAWWCLMPWRVLGHENSTVSDLLGFSSRSMRRAPWGLFALGLSGALIAQAALVFAPCGFLAGPWFVACAFAYRDLEEPGTLA